MHTEQHYRDEWTAVDDDYDGAPDARHRMGHGATREEAILDLIEKLEDDAFDRQVCDCTLITGERL